MNEINCVNFTDGICTSTDCSKKICCLMCHKVGSCNQKCEGPIKLDETIKPKPGMTRQQLSDFICPQCDEIKQLFSYKNQDYGANDDAFSDFRKTAQRLLSDLPEHEAMFKVLMILQDKHLVALSQTGLSGNEVAERLRDIANYALIGAGILADWEAQK